MHPCLEAPGLQTAPGAVNVGFYTPENCHKVPAATAVPITPATFGALHASSRKLVGIMAQPSGIHGLP